MGMMVEQCSRAAHCDNCTMSGVNSVLLKMTIVFGMLLFVMAVVYISPMPDQQFQSCDRPCHELDWPMICRIKLEIEIPEDNGICEECISNITRCSAQSCPKTSNPALRAITANRQIPAPLIQVCQNDILVVDVTNRIPGHSLTMHWRGQPNTEAPFMDGVPLITQCPILGYTTFQYKFRASAAGTHLYHAHSDHDRSMGLFGALVVRQPDRTDPQRSLYDHDEHILLLSEWPERGILINGHDSHQPTEFALRPGRRYRFRVGYTGGSSGCPITFTIDQHRLQVIALDGNAIQPYDVGSITLSKGERLDFVLKSDQGGSGYALRAKSECGELGEAIINYEGRRGLKKERRNNKNPIEGKHFDTSLVCRNQLGKVCLEDVEALEKLPLEMKSATAEKTLYLALGSRVVDVNGKPNSRMYTINNLTFSFPSSPLLTQLGQVAISTVCDEVNIPAKCSSQSVCECVHVEYIPLGTLAEIVLIDQDGNDDEQIFHLHGHHFHLMGSRQFPAAPTMAEVKRLDQKGELFSRNLNSPALKDTIRVPKNGVVAIRFKADNPGFWMLRDEKSRDWTRGMDLVLQVGDSADMVSMPSNFPTCGDYIGPDFFLM